MNRTLWQKSIADATLKVKDHQRGTLHVLCVSGSRNGECFLSCRRVGMRQR